MKRGRTGDSRVMRSSLKSSWWCHLGTWWGPGLCCHLGPAASGICYHQRPGKCLWCGPLPGDMLMAEECEWASPEDRIIGELDLLISHIVVWVRERYPPPSHLWQVGELALESWKQKSYPCPSFAAALRKADPVPCLDSTVELALHKGLAGKAARKVRMQDSQSCFLVCWAVV